jgi:hypothetical protein
MLRPKMIRVYKIQENHLSEKQATSEDERVLIQFILISNLAYSSYLFLASVELLSSKSRDEISFRGGGCNSKGMS